MRMSETLVEIVTKGKRKIIATLDKESPSGVFYIENEDFRREMAEDLSPKEVKIYEKTRTTFAFFDMAFSELEELSRLDPAAAERLRVDLGLKDYSEEEENSVYIGGGVFCTPNVLDNYLKQKNNIGKEMQS